MPPRSLTVVATVLVSVLALAVLRQRPPAPRPADAAPDVFSAMRALDRLAIILDGQPHPVGSEANRAVADRIVAQARSMGLETEIQETFVCRNVCAPVRNVLAILPGEVDGPMVMLTAHYDAVPVSPGAGDDGAGVATILEIVRALQIEGPPRHPVLALFTDGEEAGLLGAEAFVAEHPRAAAVGVVLNFEGRGTNGLSWMFETSDANRWLIEAFGAAAPRPAATSMAYEVYRLLPNDTDFSVYKRAGLEGLNFAYLGNVAHYHTPLDRIDNLDPRSVQHHGDNGLAVARQFAASSLDGSDTGNALYADLLGFVFVAVPEPWARPAAVLAVLATFAIGVMLVRTHATTAGALGHGLLWWMVATLVAIGIGPIVNTLIAAIAGNPAPWYAHPFPTRLALWTATIGLVGWVATVMGKRAGVWGLWFGTWMGHAVVAALFAFTLPGVSIVSLVPVAAGVAAVGSGVVARGGRRDGWAMAAMTFGAAIFAAIWFPMAMGLEGALGLAVPIGVTVPVAWVAATAGPMLHDRTRGRTLWLGGMTGAAAVAVVAAIVTPPYSAERPRRMNITHLENRTDGTATWAVIGTREDVPDVMRSVADFGAAPEPVFPWTSVEGYVAPAPPTDHPAPDFTVIADTVVGGERRVVGRLTSGRGAGAITLLVDDAPSTILVEGRELAVRRRGGTFVRIGVILGDRDGARVELRFGDANASPEGWVYDESHDLPVTAAAVQGARPITATTTQTGDVTIVARRISF